MLVFMENVDEIELVCIECPEMMTRAKQIFTELVSMIKYMGYFLTRLIMFTYTGETNGNYRNQYHTFGLILNTLMVPKYTFQKYSFYLAKLLSLEDQNRYFERRKVLQKQKSTFDDLIFLNKFIVQKDKRNLIRKNTVAARRGVSIDFKDFDKDFNALFDHKIMDMNEFLSHLQLKVNLEIDDIFCSDLKTIVEYFNCVEKFISDIFQMAELEIKIDLMRLILRITKATKFVNFIYILNAMKLEFLDECQIFALFCQVLLAEIKKPAIKFEPKSQPTVITDLKINMGNFNSPTFRSPLRKPPKKKQSQFRFRDLEMMFEVQEENEKEVEEEFNIYDDYNSSSDRNSKISVSEDLLVPPKPSLMNNSHKLPFQCVTPLPHEKKKNFVESIPSEGTSSSSLT